MGENVYGTPPHLECKPHRLNKAIVHVGTPRRITAGPQVSKHRLVFGSSRQPTPRLPLPTFDRGCGAQATNDTPAGQANAMIWAGFRVKVSPQLPIVHRSPCLEKISTVRGEVDLSGIADYLIPCFQISRGAFSPVQFRRRHCVKVQSKRSRHHDIFRGREFRMGVPVVLHPPLLPSFDFPMFLVIWFCTCTVRARLPLLPHLNT